MRLSHLGKNKFSSLGERYDNLAHRFRSKTFLSLGIGASASGCFIVDSPPPAVVPVEAVTGVSVISEVEADGRGLAGYSVRFQIQDALKLTARELDTSTEVKTEENNSQEQYEEFMAESSASRTEMVKEIMGLNDPKATLQPCITATKSKFEKKIGRFSGVVALLKKLIADVERRLRIRALGKF